MSDIRDKYPKIIIDDEKQAINPSMKYPLTVEEYYDLLHHTHDISSLTSSDDNSEMVGDIITNITNLTMPKPNLSSITNNIIGNSAPNTIPLSIL